MLAGCSGTGAISDSAAAGLAAFLATIFAIYGVVRYGPAWLRDSRARQQAQATAAEAQAAAAKTQAEVIQLERRRGLSGWSRHGVNTFPVELVTGKDELRQAADEITSGRPTDYVTLRVPGGADGGDSAHLIRDLVEREGAISRPPTAGELEALEAGLDAMGIPHAAY